MTQRARLVVDWGTSNFRCYRFAADGTVAQTHQAAAGILGVADRDFAAVLQREIGAWITPDMDIFLSGMITSRNGWIETPYVVVAVSVQVFDWMTLGPPQLVLHRPDPVGLVIA